MCIKNGVRLDWNEVWVKLCWISVLVELFLIKDVLLKVKIKIRVCVFLLWGENNEMYIK